MGSTGVRWPAGQALGSRRGSTHLPEATYPSWADISALGLTTRSSGTAGPARWWTAEWHGEPGRQFIRINIVTSAAILERILTGIVTGSSRTAPP